MANVLFNSVFNSSYTLGLLIKSVLSIFTLLIAEFLIISFTTASVSALVILPCLIFLISFCLHYNNNN